MNAFEIQAETRVQAECPTAVLDDAELEQMAGGITGTDGGCIPSPIKIKLPIMR